MPTTRTPTAQRWRPHWGWLGLGVPLLVISVVVFLIWLSHFRNQQVVRQIERLGGSIVKTNGRITVVDLSGSRVTDDDLALLGKLKDLKRLILSRTSVGDNELHQLFGSTDLEVIYVDDTRVTGSGVDALRYFLPQCAVVDE